MTEIDSLFQAAGSGDVAAFAEWMGRVERPIRFSLRAFARAVDVEGVVQETLLRMWLLARDQSRALAGEDASLRYALGMARNLARAEARRLKREVHLPPENIPELPVPPDPPSDPGLFQAIRECFEKLARRPREALLARLRYGYAEDDRRVARLLRMTPNTFWQNIVRARRQLADCLRGKGVPLEEILS
jgi:DNA-directed RNA polymerase specialized sigma24 family protein